MANKIIMLTLSVIAVTATADLSGQSRDNMGGNNVRELNSLEKVIKKSKLEGYGSRRHNIQEENIDGGHSKFEGKPVREQGTLTRKIADRHSNLGGNIGRERNALAGKIIREHGNLGGSITGGSGQGRVIFKDRGSLGGYSSHEQNISGGNYFRGHSRLGRRIN